MANTGWQLALLLVLVVLLVFWFSHKRSNFGTTPNQSLPYCEQTKHICAACFSNEDCADPTPYCTDGRCVSACKPDANGTMCIDGNCTDGLTDSYCDKSARPRVLRDRYGGYLLEPTSSTMPISTTVDAATPSICASAAKNAGAAVALHDANQKKCVMFMSAEGVQANYYERMPAGFTTIVTGELARAPPICRNGTCQLCESNQECGPGLLCVDSGLKCAQCGVDSDCAVGQKCLVTGNCAQCSVDADCDASAPFCDNNKCAPCRINEAGGACNYEAPYCVSTGSNTVCAPNAPLPRTGRDLQLCDGGGGSPPPPLADATMTFNECRDAAFNNSMTGQYNEATQLCSVYDNTAGLYAKAANRSVGSPQIYVFETSALPRV